MGKWIIALLLASPWFVAIGLTINNLSFLSKAQTTIGKIVNFQSQTNYNSTHNISEGAPNLPTTTYYPIVEFTTSDGKQIKFSSDTGFLTSLNTWGPAYHFGDVVRVAYISDNPYNAKIDDFVSLWMFVSICGAMGLILWFPIVLALIGKHYYYKQKHREDPINFP